MTNCKVRVSKDIADFCDEEAVTIFDGLSVCQRHFEVLQKEFGELPKHFWQSRNELGIGEIVKVVFCSRCGETINEGAWNRTDGTGEFQEFKTFQAEMNAAEKEGCIPDEAL